MEARPSEDEIAERPHTPALVEPPPGGDAPDRAAAGFTLIAVLLAITVTRRPRPAVTAARTT